MNSRTVQASQVTEIVQADEQAVIAEKAESITPRITGKLLDAPKDKLTRVREYMEANPKSKVREVAEALNLPTSTVHGYMKKVRTP